MFHKGSGLRDGLKIFVIASALVGAISLIAGPAATAKGANTVVAGTAFGGGVLIGTAPQIGPGITAGKTAAQGPTVFTP